ncbi:hypothetical protein [Aquimarina sp. 2201CG5-10]|uniref:hypothetical protein n=1 Tax=Aquimarina callyspongiae TaxID=3098150 RepID=UPI002AB431CA|nr:hypothetical protein [Aquimarina sp. 2201CG5-10]MDY8137695.1 hypothetical protein [Aquimarina sp. 2201CG5-10]
MSLQAPFTITIDPKKDVLDIRQGKLMKTLVGHDVHPNGVYELTYSSSVKYHNNEYPVDKVVVYNTNNASKGWFYTVDTSNDSSNPLIIRMGAYGTDSNKLYGFIIDVTSSDNTGTGTLTVKQIA